jgi:hypothetical protein
MSNRRIFITLAEAIRTANLDSVANHTQARKVKRIVAADLALALKGFEDFDSDRFQEHALSDTSQGRWAYNRRTGEGPGQGFKFDFERGEHDEEEAAGSMPYNQD